MMIVRVFKNKHVMFLKDVKPGTFFEFDTKVICLKTASSPKSYVTIEEGIVFTGAGDNENELVTILDVILTIQE